MRCSVESAGGAFSFVDSDLGSFVFHAPSLRLFGLPAGLSRAEGLAAARERMAGKREGDLIASFREGERLRGRGGPRMLTLDVAHACNLACAYCYAGQGDFGRPGDPALMDPAVAEAAVDLWLDALDPAPGPVPGSADPAPPLLDFAGGEPLLNMPAIEAAVRRLEARGAAGPGRAVLSVTTNATLLDAKKLGYFRSKGFRICVSVDGPRDCHDAFRKDRSGAGSYDRTAAGILAMDAAWRASSLVIRATVAPGSPRSIRERAEAVLAFGPALYSLDAAAGPGWTEAELARFDREYADYAAFVLGELERGQPLRDSLLHERLSALHAERQRPAACGLGRDVLVAAPDGALYPCHRFPGSPGLAVGTVAGGIDRDRLESFRQVPCYRKEPCASCWARYLCAGGCPADAFLERGSDSGGPSPAACRTRESTWRWTLWLYIALALRGAPIPADGAGPRDGRRELQSAHEPPGGATCSNC